MNIILFDGTCHLCSGTVSFIAKRDRKALYRFISIQSDIGQAFLKSYGVDDVQDLTTVYYLRGNRCLKQSAALIYILNDLGGMWKCFYPLIYIPSPLRNAVYCFVSRHRYKWFGRKKTCLPLGSDVRDRFIA